MISFPCLPDSDIQTSLLTSMSPTPYPLTTLILAGGRSSRMGQDKALVEMDGVPMLQRVWTVAQQCSTQTYIVTPWSNRYQAIVPNALFLEEKPIPGEVETHGPLVGFAQGLTHVTTEWALLLACDLPLLQSSVLEEWMQKLDRVSQEASALLPRHAKGWEPLCGFYRRSCLSSLNEFIAQGGRSFQRWLATQSVQKLDVPEIHMLFNCNTPEDVEKALTLQKTKAYPSLNGIEISEED